MACVEQLKVGVVTPNTNLNVFILNNTTGRITLYENILSDSNGYLTITLTEPPIKDHSYTLWVNNNLDHYTDTVGVTINSKIYQCFDLTFDKISNKQVTIQTISI